MLANVQQATIKPVIAAAVAPGTLVHTDEYSIYARLPAWGYRHKTICHGRGDGCARTEASRKTSYRSIWRVARGNFTPGRS
jgi:hypothetical protein